MSAAGKRLVGVATCAVVICVLIGLYTGLYLTRVAGIGLPHPGRAGAASPSDRAALVRVRAALRLIRPRTTASSTEGPY